MRKTNEYSSKNPIQFHRIFVLVASSSRNTNNIIRETEAR